MSTVHQQIVEYLNGKGVAFEQLNHAPTLTSEEAAAARNEPLKHGGKAIVMKLDKSFALFVLSASLRVDSAAIRTQLNVKKIRFATPDELLELTGLVPGSVPPFGEPILPLDLYVDPSIVGNPRIAFNAGSLTDSVVFAVEDYLEVAQPTVFSFARSAGGPTPGGNSD